MNQKQDTVPPLRSIEVTGTATATAAPDICYMTFIVQTEHRNAAKAYRENNRLANRVTESVKNLGIEAKDIRSINFYIMPFYKTVADSTRQVIDGYRIFHYLFVSVRDLEKASDVLDAAMEAGATGVGGINFSFADPAKRGEDVRIQALKDARAKAERTAQVLGVRLGSPIHVSDREPGGYRPYAPMRGGAELSRAAPGQEANLQPGDVHLSCTVYVTYEIEPDRKPE